MRNKINRFGVIKAWLVLPLSLPLCWASNAYSSFKYQITGQYALSSTDSGQDHKDREKHRAKLKAEYFSEPQNYSVLPSSKVSEFTKSPVYAVSIDNYSTTPRDDLRIYSLEYGYGARDVDYRWFAAIKAARHRTSYSSNNFTGGELGFSWFFLDASKATLSTSHLSDSKYKLEQHELKFAQVFTRYEHDLVLDIALGFERYERPHRHLGRIGEGFRSSYWGGKIGWYLNPQFEAGFIHKASSNFYHTGRVDSSSNALNIYAEWTPVMALTISCVLGVARETVELSTTDYDDDTGAASVKVISRF